MKIDKLIADLQNVRDQIGCEVQMTRAEDIKTTIARVLWYGYPTGYEFNFEATILDVATHHQLQNLKKGAMNRADDIYAALLDRGMIDLGL